MTFTVPAPAVSVPIPDSPLDGRAALPLRNYVHCALGTLVASQGDAQVLLSHLPEHLAIALPLTGGAILTARGDRLGWLGIVSMIAAVAFGFTHSPWVALAIAGLSILCLAELVPWGGPRLMHLLTYSLGYGVLPFWIGYLISGHRAGASALLMAIGFFAFFLGSSPLLSPGALRRRRPTIPVSVCLGMTLSGIAALGTWAWIYGAGLSGVVLMAPGAIATVWLMSGWALAHLPPQVRLRQNMLAAWLGLELALAVACYA